MAGRLIVVDGIDGVGKTVTAQYLASRLGGVYFPTPAEELRDARRYFAKRDQTAKYLFYLGALINSSVEIFQALLSSDVIVDRYIASTICYHKAAGALVSYVDWSNLPIVKPDFEFCLIVTDRQEWLRRISQRDGTDAKIAIDQDYRRFMVIARELSLFTESRGGITIDTSILLPDQVVEKILEYIHVVI